MIIAATGHRPDKLGGYSEDAARILISLAYAYLAVERPQATISGMALGWDMAVCEASIKLGIPCHAAVPFLGQESRWPRASQERYRKLLNLCASQTIVMPGGYCAFSMQLRNEWMVDRCNKIMAIWDGTEGGTSNCLKYAKKVGRPVDNLYDRLTLAHHPQNR